MQGFNCGARRPLGKGEAITIEALATIEGSKGPSLMIATAEALINGRVVPS